MKKTASVKSTKYVVIVLLIVFLVAASLLVVSIWERGRGKYPSSDEDNSTLSYNGKDYVKKDGIETYLVLGIDKFDEGSGEQDAYQADFLLLLVFDNNEKKCSSIQINRDTMVNVNRLDISGNKIDTVKKQIALAYNYVYDSSGKISCRNTADSVSDLLRGVKIDHYVSLTMESVIKINDLVGGVEVEVLDDFTGIDDSLVKGETVKLVGDQALTYVRTRKGLEDATNVARMKRQEQYLNALTKKLDECADNDSDFLLRAVEEVGPYIVYDSTEYRMKEIADKFKEYDFLGITEIEGANNVVDGYMEFTPNEDALLKIVVDNFYKLK